MHVKPRLGLEECTPDFKVCKYCIEKPTLEFSWRRSKTGKMYCSQVCLECQNAMTKVRQHRFKAKRALLESQEGS